MLDGRCDQHFVEIFAASLADANKTDEQPSRWPLAVAYFCGLAVFAFSAALA